MMRCNVPLVETTSAASNPTGMNGGGRRGSRWVGSGDTGTRLGVWPHDKHKRQAHSTLHMPPSPCAHLVSSQYTVYAPIPLRPPGDRAPIMR